MKHQIASTVFILCLMMACTDQKKETDGEPTKEPEAIGTTDMSKPADEPSARQFTVRPGVRITFTETHPVGMSSSDVAVKLEGDMAGELAFRDIDPVIDILEGDLDMNDSKEWYIITGAAGSGSYGNIKAITVTKDETLDEILIPDLTAEEGYEGHDQFSMDNGKLVRRFPLYKKGDENSKPTGGQKEIHYTLIQFPGGKYALDREK
jgi:hypothetical protein